MPDPKNQEGHNKEFIEYTAQLRKKYMLNNKLLLIQPPQFLINSFNLKVAKSRGCYAYPPSGLQCIARALSKAKLEIDILDLNYEFLRRIINNGYSDSFDWLSILDEYLGANNPSVIGVTCISVYTDVLKDTHPLTAILKNLRRKDKSVIIAGGPIATNEHENYLMKGLCHFVIEGEGENKIIFLFDYLLRKNICHSPVRGIHFKFEDRLHETKGKEDIVILKGNLIDTYKHVIIENYHSVGSLNPFSRMAGQNKRFATIQLNRGCRANCKFCGVIDFMGKGLRQYPVTDLLREIYYLVEKRGVRHFEILDDDFLGYKSFRSGAVALLCEMVKINKKYGISWAAGNGLVAASLTEEALQLMKDSGCVGFRIGIESGNENMLRQLRKPASLSALRKTGKMLQRFPEMFVDGNYIIGSFGKETFGEMMDTFRFACEMNIDWAAFNTFQYTSKAIGLAENSKLEGKLATNFIPTRDSSSREIVQGDEIVSGPEVFHIPKSSMPSREQIKHIWFAFNLVANYIANKNLTSGGRPEKFISWVEAVHIAYPDNPYMPLFAGIGYVLLGNRKSANKHLIRARENMEASTYWIIRFSEFGLRELIEHFPGNAQETEEVLESMRRRYLEPVR